jgi:hypothetical protein
MNVASIKSSLGHDTVRGWHITYRLEIGRSQYVVKSPFELSVEERIAALMHFLSRQYKPNVRRGEPQVIYLLTHPEMSERRQMRT